MFILYSSIFMPLLIPLWFSNHLFLKIVEYRVATMATTYVRFVAIGGMISNLARPFDFATSGQGKPRYNILSTILASVVHFFLAPYLCDTLGWKFTGIAISSSI